MGCPPMDYAIMAMWTLVIWQLAMGIGNWQLIGYWVLGIGY